MAIQQYSFMKSAGSGPPNRRWRFVPSVVVGVTLLVGSALPASGIAATLQGMKFNDADNSATFTNGDLPYTNHRIMIRNRTTGETFRARTNADGSYEITDIPMDGDYILSTAYPTGKCLTTLVTAVSFNNPSAVRELNLGFGSCDEPIKDACDEPTHTSVQNGAWDFPGTWNTGTVPGDGDRVLMTHRVEAPNTEIILGGGGLCNQGELWSPNGELLACGLPALPGGNIVIFARQVTNTPEGMILSGNGGTAPDGATGECRNNSSAIYQECGNGVSARGGNGGTIEIFSTTTINDGDITSGYGGNAASFHASTIAGNGGLVKIITDVSDENNASQTLPITTGDGGKACGNSWNRWGPLTAGKAGDIEAQLRIISPFGGEAVHWTGKAGSTFHWDPIKLKATKGLKISGYSNIEIYTDEGGTIDLTELAEGAISAEVIRIQTKALNGSGGTLDLRGLSGNIFKATQKVEIYADDIKTDAGVDVRSLIDAPEISINPGRIAYFVSMSATSLVIGEPNETIELSLRVNNIGPKTDTYRFEATSSKGWLLGTLANVTLKGMEVKTIKLPITLPAQRGLVDDIKIVATSQTNSSVTKELNLQILVNAGDDSDGDSYPDSLDAFPDDSAEWRDSDNDGIGNNADTDDDNDGMSDDFEAQYFEVLNSVVDDAELDPDEDGFSNIKESQDNTDPTDPDSKPVVEPEKVSLTLTQSTNGTISAKGIDCGEDCTEDYELNSEVTLTATPNEGYNFNDWKGDCAGTTAELTVTLDKAKSCTATFAEIPNESPTGALTITPESGNTPLTVALDGSASKDTDGTIASYTWTASNGQTAEGQNAELTFKDAGEYTITLKVSDNDGATHSITSDKITVFKVGEYTAHGTLRDELGQPIVGAKVQIGDDTTTTDAAGNWEIKDLLEGDDYTVTASKDGYTFTPEKVALGNEVFKQKVTLKPVSALSVKLVSKPSVVKQDENVTYTMTVINGGDETATELALNPVLPAGTTLVSLEAVDDGDCDADTLTCTLSDLVTGGSARFKMVLNNTQTKTLVTKATVTANEYPADVAQRWTKVIPYLSLSISDTPEPLEMAQSGVDRLLHYTLAVELSDKAPSDATGIELVSTLPTGVELESVNTDYGVCDTSELPKLTCSITDLSVDSADDISQVAVNVDVALKDAGVLLLTHEAKVSANEYPTHTDRERTKVFIPDSIQVDIAFVIDNTGSMQEEINGVKKALLEFIKELGDRQAPLTALITFKDDVTVSAFTRNMDVLKGAIHGIKAEGGGTCPEASVEAINVAASHTKNGGIILFSTDASPYDDADVVASIERLREKAIQFNPVITGDCTEESSWNELPN